MISAVLRPFAGESDIPQIAELIAACQAVRPIIQSNPSDAVRAI